MAESSADRARRTPKLQWYGWQIAIMDGAGLALTAIWLLDSDDLFFLAIGAGAVFTLGAPITHWVHGFTSRGFTSLAVRAVAMLSIFIGLITLVGSDDPSASTRASVFAAVGFLGIATMSIVDLAVLAFEPAPQRSVLDEEPTVVVIPWLVPRASTYGVHAALRW